MNDTHPHLGRVVKLMVGDGQSAEAVIIRADAARYLVDLDVSVTGGYHAPNGTEVGPKFGGPVEQQGVRWWTGQYRPSWKSDLANMCWDADLPVKPFNTRAELWAGELPVLTSDEIRALEAA